MVCTALADLASGSSNSSGNYIGSQLQRHTNCGKVKCINLIGTQAALISCILLKVWKGCYELDILCYILKKLLIK